EAKLELDPGNYENGNLNLEAVFSNIQTRGSKEWLLNNDVPEGPTYSKWSILFLAYQSIGVIYGDIGTSPLYVYSSTFSSNPAREDLLGALSMIIWTLTLVVTTKYVFFVLRASDNGEGGTFALYSLLARYTNITWRNPHSTVNFGLQRYSTNDLGYANRGFRASIEQSKVLRHFIAILSIIGVSMVMADGVLTPAQSVLGAIQGLNLKIPNFPQVAVTGISEAILILLFLIQPFGTTKIAVCFAPIVTIWLFFNFSIGLYNIITFDHTVLSAFSPYWIYSWFARNGSEGWVNMGGILLAFTGVEALFADLGHFSRPSVQLSWCFVTYPSLLLAYIGQAAFISMDPTGTAYSNPFFSTVPPSAFWFAFIISILAAIVASQAMISGCFSILSQAMSLSNFPQLKVIHTSDNFHGQIYIPAANWLLMIGTVVITAAFPNTTSLGNAYGACVTFVTLITTTLVTIVSIVVWKWNILLSILFFLIFGFIDGAYLSATLLKVPQGAWVTIAIAAAISLVMIIWHTGKHKQWEYEAPLAQDISDQIVADVVRQNGSEKVVLSLKKTQERLENLNGLAIVFDSAGFGLPPVFSHFTGAFAAAPDITIFLHIRNLPQPTVPLNERMVVFRLDIPKMYRVVIRRGYKDVLEADSKIGPSKLVVSRLCELLEQEGSMIERDAVLIAQTNRVTYLMSTIEYAAASNSHIGRRLLVQTFNFIRKITRGVRRYEFGVPNDKLIEVGMRYDI
ncbi:hypothetical protein INT43_004386, partial [Umbelopsis isabellina]